MFGKGISIIMLKTYILFMFLLGITGII